MNERGGDEASSPSSTSAPFARPLPGFDPQPIWQVCGSSDASADAKVWFRKSPDAFLVEEIPAYRPSGAGEHLYLFVEKIGLSTRALVQHVGDVLGLHEREIGYAGQKDERAVSRQWLSVPARAGEAGRPALDARLEAVGARVLEAMRHGNKLRLGHTRGNRFTIALEGAIDVAALAHRLEAVRRVPNLFGAQRFGHDDATLREAERFVGRRAVARSRRERFWVSAIQSSLFNAWLADRIADGTWCTPLLGDALEKVQNGAPFSCADPTADRARAEAGEIVVAGPLVGAAMRPAHSDALTRESRSWSTRGVDVDALTAHPAFGVGARRPAWLDITDVESTPLPDGIRIGFSLRKGAYASVVLAAWFGPRLIDAAFADSD